MKQANSYLYCQSCLSNATISQHHQLIKCHLPVSHLASNIPSFKCGVAEEVALVPNPRYPPKKPLAG